MYYMLMRVHILQRSTRYVILVFDLWNEASETGYEVHLTIPIKKKQSAFAIAKDYIACIYDISDWDLIFREIRGVNND